MRGGRARDENAIRARRSEPQQPFADLRMTFSGLVEAAARVHAHPRPYPAPTEQVWEMKDNASGRHWRMAARRHAGMQAAEQERSCRVLVVW